VSLRFRNWSRFQHYANRAPPWIKLHRSLVDDEQYHALSGDGGKYLPLAWIIASESNGELPDSKRLAFRLRVSEAKAQTLVAEWSCWLIDDAASTALADSKQCINGMQHNPSTLTLPSSSVSEGGTGGVNEGFERFWAAWPRHHRKTNRAECLRRWRSCGLEAHTADILAGIEAWKSSRDWLKDGGQYIPAPLVWLNQERWTADFAPGVPEKPYEPNI